MLDQHPITPPPELVQQWRAAASNVPACLSTDPGGRRDYIDFIATQASQWGADMELDACCEWLDCRGLFYLGSNLRAARRPKPPSLKERALAALNVIEDKMLGPTTEEKLIRQALEALPND